MIELVEDVKALQDLVETCCSSATDLTCAFWRIRCDCCMENAWQSKLIMDTRTIVYQIGLLQLSAHPSRLIYYIYPEFGSNMCNSQLNVGNVPFGSPPTLLWHSENVRAQHRVWVRGPPKLIKTNEYAMIALTKVSQ